MGKIMIYCQLVKTLALSMLSAILLCACVPVEKNVSGMAEMDNKALADRWMSRRNIHDRNITS